jgi:hypothetical protein
VYHFDNPEIGNEILEYLEKIVDKGACIDIAADNLEDRKTDNNRQPAAD